MNEEMYFLDNNALSHLTRAQRSSAYFRERCRLPSEVLHEAMGYPDAEAFEAVEYTTTSSVLELVRAVMETEREGDTALLNLYANKGAADPMIIACALDATRETAALLFGPTWIVVSNDNAVRAKARELEVESCTREEFLSRTRGEWDAR